jgi:hypothetical protein
MVQSTTAVKLRGRWQTRFGALPDDCRAIVTIINDGDPDRGMFPDFASSSGSGSSTIWAGIPFVTVDSDPTKCESNQFPPGPTDFYRYPTESDTTAGE